MSGTRHDCESVTESDFKSSSSYVAEAVESYLENETEQTKLDCIVVRVVAPGTYFQRHAEIDKEYLKQLEKSALSAPLHTPAIIEEIKQLQKAFKNIPLIAASDSFFHRNMPAKARDYSLPEVDSDKFDIYRFGYHGLSVASIIRRIHPLIGRDPERVVVCHVGSGTSVTAVKKGWSVETTMGFSPSSGLVMGSRAGDLDGSALLELMRVKNLELREALTYINQRGGLVGLAEESDIRHLLDRRAHHDPVATGAIDTFVYGIQKAVAAQTVALGGLDVLVLTATAAVRSIELRRLILAGLTHLGLQVSDDRNNLLVGKDGLISTRNSAVKVVVMQTDEMGEMLGIAKQFNY